MKIFVISMFLSAVCTASAQTNTLELETSYNSSREAWRDTCFGLLDKSPTQIPSGYLLDYSLAGFDSWKYDGRGTDDETIDADGRFFSLYHILQLSKVNDQATLMPIQDLFISARRFLRDNQKIPLLFLFQPYQKINPSALGANLYSLDRDSFRLMDVPGRHRSPYNNNEIFIFCPAQTFISSYSAVRFSLPDLFWSMPGITSVQIDFGDGAGPRMCNKNSEIDVQYTTEGIKYLSARISTRDGNLIAKTTVQYQRPQFFFQPDISWKINIPARYTSIDHYLAGGHAKNSAMQAQTQATICTDENIFVKVNCDIDPGAEISIENGCDRLFDKPVIIVSGFDANDDVSMDAIISSYYKNQFIYNLRSAGYDIVFVRLTKPLDFIENNALVLEEVVKRVNNTRAGNQRSVVIGYSMGGLVARWCLKDMEDKGLDHQVGKYFSFDTPHQGANIPLGLQYLYAEMERDFEYLKWNNLGGKPISSPFQNLASAFNSPAARQMLVTRADYSNAPFNWNPLLSTLDPVRAAFAERLNNKGYPKGLVRYGIAFGRGNNTTGTKQAGNGVQFNNFGPGTKIFDGAITWVLVNVQATAHAVPENGISDYICRYRFSGLKVARLFNLPIGPLFTIRARNFKYRGQFAYDDAPGGYEITQSKFVENFNESRGLATNAGHMGHRGHNFVSTVSGLDLQNQGYSSTNSWQSNNLYFNIDNQISNPGQLNGNTLTDPTLSPFQYLLTYTSDCNSIFCESETDVVAGAGSPVSQYNDWNQYHNGRISTQATHFMVRKILGAAPGTTCKGICNTAGAYIIGADGPLCNAEVYGMSGMSVSGLKINWSTQFGFLEVAQGQGTNNVTLRRVANANGEEIVKLTLSNSCGNFVVFTKKVLVGAPAPKLEKRDQCPILIVNVTDRIKASNYTWNITTINWEDNQREETTIENVTGYLSLKVGQSQNGISTNYCVRYTNNCGTSGKSCGGITCTTVLAPAPRMRISPNPARNQVKVQLNNIDLASDCNKNAPNSIKDNAIMQAPSGALIYGLTIFNSFGNKVWDKKYHQGIWEAIINISSLPGGLYTVIINPGSNIKPIADKLIISR